MTEAGLKGVVADAAQGNAQPDFNDQSKYFFFKKRCNPD
jgi:hypothetical protein